MICQGTRTTSLTGKSLHLGSLIPRFIGALNDMENLESQATWYIGNQVTFSGMVFQFTGLEGFQVFNSTLTAHITWQFDQHSLSAAREQCVKLLQVTWSWVKADVMANLVSRSQAVLTIRAPSDPGLLVSCASSMAKAFDPLIARVSGFLS